MSGECICGADEPCTGRCERHGRDLHGYPCGECEREWIKANPKTHAAIAKIAAGKGSLAALAAARRADLAALPTPATETRESAGSETDRG